MLTFSRPLRVAVLCAHRSPGILDLRHRDPRRGIARDLVRAVTSEDTFAERAEVETAGVPVVVHLIARFAGERGVKPDRSARAAYDRETHSLREVA